MKILNISILKWLVYLALLLNTIRVNAQTLTAVSASGYDSTTLSSFSTVNGAFVTINTTDVNAILVVSTFQIDMNFASPANRDAGFRIVDNSDNTITSGEIHRSLSNAKNYDYGIGSLVHIFDVSALSGDRTYSFQHNISNNKKLDTHASIVAIALKSGTEHLKYDVKRVSPAVSTTTSWEGVTGSETTTITTSVSGGFYVAASVQSIATIAPAVGEWKLQYQKGTGLWTDLTPAVPRSISNTTDIGIVNLVGTLPDWSGAGNYKFRIAHKKNSGGVNTVAANIVAVSLGTASGVYPVFSKSATGVTTTSTSMENAVTATMAPTLNTKLFIHAQYGMSASAQSNAPEFDVYVDNGKLDGYNQKRYLSSSSDYGSGGSIGLSNELTANTTYNVSFRHASTAGVTLTSSNILLSGFGLTIQSGPLPIELLYLNAECGSDSAIDVKWATASEQNNDYFTLYKSNDGINWIEITKIKGAGNSSSTLNYEFVDIKPTLQNTYYKLMQTDYDGKSEEVKITSINCNDTHKKIEIFPNPAKDILYVNFHNDSPSLKPLKITIYDSFGKLCSSEEFYSSEDENPHKIILPRNLKPGVYFVHAIHGEDYLNTSQITIIK